MSRKHYEAIAAAIRTATITDGTVKLDVLLRELGYVFAADNPRFDGGRFVRAAQGIK